MASIAERLAGLGGAGLFLDYSTSSQGSATHCRPCASTITKSAGQSGRSRFHRPCRFRRLAAIVRAHGLDAHLSTQGEFLVEMGLLERAGQLAPMPTRPLAKGLRRGRTPRRSASHGRPVQGACRPACRHRRSALCNGGLTSLSASPTLPPPTVADLGVAHLWTVAIFGLSLDEVALTDNDAAMLMRP